GGLTEIQMRRVELNSLAQENSTLEVIPINQGGISQIKLISKDYQNGEYQLDYLIELEDSENIDYANLGFSFQGEPILSSGVTYKRPEPNVIKRSQLLNIGNKEVENLVMYLEYHDKVAYHPETWKLDFQYNHDLAKKSTYTLKVNQ